jgi:nanoRNase/pAp phosphatase (c-di-AMP/oligoRNAs hydrolase)
MLAMRQILSDMGKQVDCYTTDKPSVMFDRVVDISQVQTAIDYNQRYTGLIFLDFTEYNRIPRLTAGHEDRFDSHHKIIIDHHEVQTTMPLTISYIVPEITSTCELLYEIWSEVNPWAITPTVATHLYLWLTTDTANYLHDGNSTQTLQRGINLINYGADKKLVQDMILRSYSLGSLQFLWIFMSRLVESNWIYYSYYTDDDLLVCGIDKEWAEIGTQMLQSIANSDIVMIFKIKEDMINFSFRTKITAIDHIARHYGGGWHRHASWGARVALKTWVEIEIQLQQIVHEVGQMILLS